MQGTMDNLERYYRLLDDLCCQTLDDERSSYEFIADAKYARLVAELIGLRKQFLALPDIQRVSDFASSGLLPAVTSLEDRTAAFCIVLELEDRLRRERRRRACSPYDRSQPLFGYAPQLWDRVRADGEAPGDLLHMNGLNWDVTGQLAEIGGGNWARLDSALHSDVIRWLRQEAAKVPAFVRLDPFHAGPKVAILAEATLRPADPRWWRRLEVWPGGEKASTYALTGYSPRDLSDYWDFHARGARRLEVAFRRRNSGHFFGSIEELSKVTDGYYTGLLLHMDSADPVGTEWHTAALGHLDGAINIYEGEPATARFKTSHADGKVPNATCRTHLFRVDGVPLGWLIPIAHHFFRSGRLLDEWVRDQFGSVAR